MKKYSKDKIRNLVLLGHGGSGKTTLTEAILYNKEVIKRMGKVEDGNTVSDFDKEEKERQFSIGSSVIPVEFEGTKFNFIDTPGYFDFVGEVFASMTVSSGAIIVVDASSGVEVGTEKAWRFAEKRNVPRIIFLNKMDKENVKFEQVLEDLREKLGKKIVPFAVPIGEEKD
ncbi:MAG TPA: elongation factor G, partial [Clostridiales bacterium]|nr:elongation factor G [Clostridiales bacterium]